MGSDKAYVQLFVCSPYLPFYFLGYLFVLVLACFSIRELVIPVCRESVSTTSQVCLSLSVTTITHHPLFRKQAALPALASILRNKQVQFLPVQWRASLNIGEEEQRERERDGLDNTFSISGISYFPGSSHHLTADI